MDDDIFSSFGFLLLRIVKAHRGLLRHRMHAHGLHRGQPPVLFALQEKDGMANSELAEFLEITPATLTNKIKRMERLGLVTKQRDPEDARISRIYLTEKGRGIMDNLRETNLAMEAVLLKGFSKEEIKSIKSQLERVLENIEAEESRLG
jgi:DNA-binding MarR family transcriptional regulator